MHYIYIIKLFACLFGCLSVCTMSPINVKTAKLIRPKFVWNLT